MALGVRARSSILQTRGSYLDVRCTRLRGRFEAAWQAWLLGDPQRHSLPAADHAVAQRSREPAWLAEE